MFKEIKLPFNISLMEALTIFFFITLGYLFIYRYSYYNTLGIPWYITSITPSQVLTGSFKVFLNLFVGGMLSLIVIKLSNFFNSYKELVLLLFMSLLWVVWSVFVFGGDLVFSKSLESFFERSELSITSLLNYSLILLMLRMVIRLNNRLGKGKAIIVDSLIIPDNIFTPKSVLDKEQRIISEKIILNYISILVVVVLTPVSMANKDAVYLLENRKKALNLVILKGDKDRWFLMEMTGDKVLLIKENQVNNVKNEYKLIEYKEVKTILASPKDDMDKKFIKYASTFVKE